MGGDHLAILNAQIAASAVLPGHSRPLAWEVSPLTRAHDARGEFEAALVAWERLVDEIFASLGGVSDGFQAGLEASNAIWPPTPFWRQVPGHSDFAKGLASPSFRELDTPLRKLRVVSHQPLLGHIDAVWDALRAMVALEPDWEPDGATLTRIESVSRVLRVSLMHLEFLVAEVGGYTPRGGTNPVPDTYNGSGSRRLDLFEESFHSLTWATERWSHPSPMANGRGWALIYGTVVSWFDRPPL